MYSNIALPYLTEYSLYTCSIYSKPTESYNCYNSFFYLIMAYVKNIMQSKHIRKSKVYEVS